MTVSACADAVILLNKQGLYRKSFAISKKLFEIVTMQNFFGKSPHILTQK